MGQSRSYVTIKKLEQEKTMSEKNEHYFEALDNDGDREVEEVDENETRQQRINRMMKESLSD